MASYNWWRRNSKRKTLKKSTPFIDRMKNGDFRTSQYLKEAQKELETAEEISNEIRSKGEANNWGEQTIKHDIKKETDQYQRRYNRLIKDFLSDDSKILKNLRIGLKREFNDYWEYLYQRWLNDELDDLTVEELYDEYNELSEMNFKP